MEAFLSGAGLSEESVATVLAILKKEEIYSIEALRDEFEELKPSLTVVSLGARRALKIALAPPANAPPAQPAETVVVPLRPSESIFTGWHYFLVKTRPFQKYTKIFFACGGPSEVYQILVYFGRSLKKYTMRRILGTPFTRTGRYIGVTHLVSDFYTPPTCIHSIFL